MIYTGIGSKDTPSFILSKMTKIATNLSDRGWLLRSGGAWGADHAFEIGAQHKRIYLPWNGFNNKYADNKSYIVPPYNEELVDDYHPASYRFSEATYKLMSRNSYQILGDDLNTPTDFVICYTQDGKASGGTGQALRIAKDYRITIYNLFYPEDFTRLQKDLNIKYICTN